MNHVEDHIHVLLIEDRPEDVEFTSVILSLVKHIKFTIEWAPCLEDGFRLMSDPTKHFDVILLDLNLPESKGIDTLSRVMSHMPQAPVVVLTGLDDEKIALEALHKGAQDYLIKGDANGKTLPRIMRYAIERKRYGDLLRASEDRFKRFLETAAVSVVCLSSSHRILEFNHEAETIFRTHKEDVLGRDFSKLFVPSEEQSRFSEGIEQVMSGNLITHRRTTVHDSDGNERILSCNLSRMVTVEGRPIGALVCSHDVTDDARLNEKIVIKDKLYRLLVQHTPNTAVFVINRDGQFTTVEGNAFKTFAVTPSFFEGKSVFDFLTLKQRAKVETLLANAFKGTEETFEECLQGRNYLVHLLPIPNGKNQIPFVMAIARD
ncbi:MAG: hypothetical protein COV74_04280 [Candidatus Omnitrophica bacterium CG11_big_fil_rev_8_21_14_0_20_45_26]|uniref:PAS domain S-box protein n=1 Tax=Candidatus Abzuiibacterium crystallinum TaxID=1974748 RepID=A0A2H0LQH6_9BACT|nr:MAG: hypothetical protein COV74_04280 [Candidatus Omnitrophica bacterium CG11_big_fil_rev_8_21_14_0_20_45_26]PIW63971.1 MAG: hypothetical protein COW12_08700 [Candidatus Omnitrophica bacterium CG12_big_fil_rev_8_21_14_0_65_45_16]